MFRYVGYFDLSKAVGTRGERLVFECTGLAAAYCLFQNSVAQDSCTLRRGLVFFA